MDHIPDDLLDLQSRFDQWRANRKYQRDQERQTLTFPQISRQQLQALSQSAPDEAGRIKCERIFSGLRRFLIDSDKRDKALLVARKLGIDPDGL